MPARKGEIYRIVDRPTTPNKTWLKCKPTVQKLLAWKLLSYIFIKISFISNNCKKTKDMPNTIVKNNKIQEYSQNIKWWNPVTVILDPNSIKQPKKGISKGLESLMKEQVSNQKQQVNKLPKAITSLKINNQKADS